MKLIWKSCKKINLKIFPQKIVTNNINVSNDTTKVSSETIMMKTLKRVNARIREKTPRNN